MRDKKTVQPWSGNWKRHFYRSVLIDTLLMCLVSCWQVFIFRSALRRIKLVSKDSIAKPRCCSILMFYRFANRHLHWILRIKLILVQRGPTKSCVRNKRNLAELHGLYVYTWVRDIRRDTPSDFIFIVDKFQFTCVKIAILSKEK